MERPLLISVCICTYKRPEGLSDLLQALKTQEGLLCLWEMVVVDNDANGSARTVVKHFQEGGGPAVHYAIEPRQNIALARNRSVAMARGQWIAFVDDDEVPEPNWLSHLLSTAQRYSADGVFAPVIPTLPDCAPSWIRRGAFFDRPRQKTGDPVPGNRTRTSNAMIVAKNIKERKEPFDPQFGLTGGSDFHLFDTMLSEGAQFVWSDEAIVYEKVPAWRANLGWLLRRAIRGGQIYVQHRIITGGKHQSFGMALHGLAVMMVAVSAALLLLPFGVHRSVWWLRKGATGLGKVLVFFPWCRYEEYRSR